MTAPLQTDQDGTICSDSKDEEEEVVYDQEDAEAGNDALKQKSIKMKDVHTRMNKGPKAPQEKPKQSTLKVTKINDPKKIKAEMPDELKSKPKPKLRTKDVAKYQSNDNPAKDDMYDDDSNRNVGVHNMSTSPDSERNMDVDEVHDETIETKGHEVERLDWAEVRNEKHKDKLITTETGEIIRRENYVIPRKQR